MSATVQSPITGTVWKIMVKEGDDVQVGQVLVILESMKMEVPVEEPSKGKVAEIKCKEGEAVDESRVLLTLT